MNEIDTGRKAELLLNNDVFDDAVSEVKKDLMMMWEDSISKDDEGREALYRELHGLKAVIARLNAKIMAGEFKAKE